MEKDKLILCPWSDGTTLVLEVWPVGQSLNFNVISVLSRKAFYELTEKSEGDRFGFPLLKVVLTDQEREKLFQLLKSAFLPWEDSGLESQ